MMSRRSVDRDMAPIQSGKLLRIKEQQALVGDPTDTGPMILHPRHAQDDRAGTVPIHMGLHELPVLIDRGAMRAEGENQTNPVLGTEDRAWCHYQFANLGCPETIDQNGGQS